MTAGAVVLPDLHGVHIFVRRPTAWVHAFKRHADDEAEVREFLGLGNGAVSDLIDLPSGQRLVCRQSSGDWLVKRQDGWVQVWDCVCFEREFVAVHSGDEG